jgi:hypothetical protein
MWTMEIAVAVYFGYFFVFCYFYHFLTVVTFELETKEYAINTIFNAGFAFFGFTAAKLVL